MGHLESTLPRIGATFSNMAASRITFWMEWRGVTKDVYADPQHRGGEALWFKERNLTDMPVIQELTMQPARR